MLSISTSVSDFILPVYKLSTIMCRMDKCRQPIYDTEQAAKPKTLKDQWPMQIKAPHRPHLSVFLGLFY